MANITVRDLPDKKKKHFAFTLYTGVNLECPRGIQSDEQLVLAD